MTFFLVELKVTSWIAILVHHWIKYNLINAMPSEQLTNKWYFIKITARLQFTMKIFLFAGIIERLLHLVNRNRKSNDPQLLFFFTFSVHAIKIVAHFSLEIEKETSASNYRIICVYWIFLLREKHLSQSRKFFRFFSALSYTPIFGLCSFS